MSKNDPSLGRGAEAAEGQEAGVGPGAARIIPYKGSLSPQALWELSAFPLHRREEGGVGLKAVAQEED